MIIKNQNNHNYFSEKEKMEKYQEYIQALEQEHKKIQVFQRELPLCLELVTQAIETCKKKISGTPSNDFDLNGVQSECSEQTSSDVRPVFEEFIPIKKAASSHSDSAEQESKNPTNLNSFDVNENNSKKSDWLNSVQLWNQTPDPPSKEDSLVKRNGSGGAFHPFKKEKSVSNGDMADPPAKRTVDGSAPPASTAETGDGNNKKEEKAGQRKSRRSWSPELHRRFVQALQQLGGSHVATPKQIREFMKVDGLTNDEVKSHLQKFRLHTRRPAPSINNNSTQTTQFVVVGGIFLPPEYAAMAATTTAETGESSVTKPKGIYAPIATLPPPFIEAPVSSPKRRKQSNSDDRGSSHSEGRSHSQTLSESTHMTADSPAY